MTTTLQQRLAPAAHLIFLPIFLMSLMPMRIAERATIPTPTTIGEKPAVITASLPKIETMKVKKTIWLTVTAYSSTVDQTDGDPFTTASGARVRDGIIAHNGLPFGTRVRFPDKFGEKVFVVQDRLHPRKGYYIADIWMETREQAKQWGAPVVRMEILETPQFSKR